MDLNRIYGGMVISVNIIIAILLLDGCSPKVQKFFPADQQTNRDVAIIQLHDGRILSIDNKKCYFCMPSALRNMEVYVLPGEHIIEYALIPSPYDGPKGFRLKVYVEPGKRYMLREHQLILGWDPLFSRTYRTYSEVNSIRFLSLRNDGDPWSAVLYSPFDPKNDTTDFLVSQYMEDTNSPQPKTVLRMNAIPN